MSRRTGQVAQTQGNRQADSSSQYKTVVALSSAESELYAIRTGAQEGLHIANFIKEATTTKVNIRIHTDSTSGKSIATRIGSSKKAKHIDLKYLFIQQLVQNGILSIHKISTHDNPADILTKYVPAEVLNKHLYMAGIHCHNITTDHRPNNVSQQQSNYRWRAMAHYFLKNMDTINYMYHYIISKIFVSL